MKKFGVALLILSMLIALVACGGNNNNVENHHIMSEQEIQDLLASLESSEPYMSANQPEEYATFGETLTLGHRFEITFVDNVTISKPRRSPLNVEPVRVHEVYESNSEIIMIPVVLTNIAEIGHTLSASEVSIIAPNEARQGHTDFDAAMRLMGEDIDAILPTIHRSIAAGETIEGYIFLVYDGDGDYLIRLPHRDNRYNVRLLISR